MEEPGEPAQGFGALARLRKTLECPLCGNVFEKPHSFGTCGHTFCYNCVIDTLEGPGISKSQCPTCKQPGWKRDLVFNHQFNNMVECVREMVAKFNAGPAQKKPVGLREKMRRQHALLPGAQPSKGGVTAVTAAPASATCDVPGRQTPDTGVLIARDSGKRTKAAKSSHCTATAASPGGPVQEMAGQQLQQLEEAPPAALAAVAERDEGQLQMEELPLQPASAAAAANPASTSKKQSSSSLYRLASKAVGPVTPEGFGEAWKTKVLSLPTPSPSMMGRLRQELEALDEAIRLCNELPCIDPAAAGCGEEGEAPVGSPGLLMLPLREVSLAEVLPSLEALPVEEALSSSMAAAGSAAAAAAAAGSAAAAAAAAPAEVALVKAATVHPVPDSEDAAALLLVIPSSCGTQEAAQHAGQLDCQRPRLSTAAKPYSTSAEASQQQPAGLELQLGPVCPSAAGLSGQKRTIGEATAVGALGKLSAGHGGCLEAAASGDERKVSGRKRRKGLAASGRNSSCSSLPASPQAADGMQQGKAGVPVASAPLGSCPAAKMPSRLAQQVDAGSGARARAQPAGPAGPAASAGLPSTGAAPGPENEESDDDFRPLQNWPAQQLPQQGYSEPREAAKGVGQAPAAAPAKPPWQMRGGVGSKQISWGKKRKAAKHMEQAERLVEVFSKQRPNKKQQEEEEDVQAHGKGKQQQEEVQVHRKQRQPSPPHVQRRPERRRQQQQQQQQQRSPLRRRGRRQQQQQHQRQHRSQKEFALEVGSRVRVTWVEGKYDGRVSGFDPTTGEHLIEYDDGDVAFHNLSQEDWELLEPTAPLPPKQQEQQEEEQEVVDEQQQQQQRDAFEFQTNSSGGERCGLASGGRHRSLGDSIQLASAPSTAGHQQQEAQQVQQPAVRRRAWKGAVVASSSSDEEEGEQAGVMGPRQRPLHLPGQQLQVAGGWGAPATRTEGCSGRLQQLQPDGAGGPAAGAAPAAGKAGRMLPGSRAITHLPGSQDLAVLLMGLATDGGSDAGPPAELPAHSFGNELAHPLPPCKPCPASAAAAPDPEKVPTCAAHADCKQQQQLASSADAGHGIGNGQAVVQATSRHNLQPPHVSPTPPEAAEARAAAGEDQGRSSLGAQCAAFPPASQGQENSIQPQANSQQQQQQEEGQEASSQPAEQSVSAGGTGSRKQRVQEWPGMGELLSKWEFQDTEMQAQQLLEEPASDVRAVPGHDSCRDAASAGQGRNPRSTFDLFAGVEGQQGRGSPEADAEANQVSPAGTMPTKFFVLSGEDSNVHARVNECIIKLRAAGRTVKEPFVTERTTHVLVSTDDQGRSTGRTMKYMQGVARGVWVVSYAWLDACAKAGCWVPERNFEVKGDYACWGAPLKSRVERNGGKRGLFDGHTAFVHNATHQSGQGLVRLLEAAGAKVLTRLPSKHDPGRLWLFVPGNNKETRRAEKDARELKARTGKAVLKWDWVFDCISNWKVLPQTSHYMWTK